MDYRDLAKQLLDNMQTIHQFKPPRRLTDTMGGEIFMLKYLKINNGNVLPGDISTEMNISSARVAAALNSLERKGYITRQIDVNDRRRILVSLTEEGKAFEASIHEKVINDASRLLEALGEHDARECVRLLGRIVHLCNK